MKKEKAAYEKFLENKCKYWQQLALAERKKNMKLEEIIKDIENRIHNLEGDKRCIYRIIS